MTKYEKSLAFIYGRIGAGIKVGTRNSLLLAGRMGAPHAAVPAIHIAGTSGKGSTATILETVLRTAGYTTGLYTSPHLHDFRERIRINGLPIPERDVTAFVKQHGKDITDVGATYFEAATALAFYAFARHRVDIAVIETGLGGTHDATNIITPLVSVITPVSYDHTGYLGTTLGAIAGEKAGIIKPGIPVVTAPQRPTVHRVLARRSRQTGSQLTDAVTAIPMHGVATRVGATRFTLHTDCWGVIKARMTVSGSHQAQNARTALTALQTLQTRFPVTAAQICSGLRAVTIRARIELIGRNPDIIVDMAHNPEKIGALAALIKTSYPSRRIIVVLGVMKDKDITGILKVISQLHPALVVTCAPHSGTGREMGAEELARNVEKMGMNAKPLPVVREAVGYARTQARQRSVIIITGSIHTAAAATE